MQVGPVFSGMSGVDAVPHSEIRAWSKNIGLKFEGLEAEWLHHMSKAYAQEVSRSDGQNTTAPYVVIKSSNKD